jgi:hypothetical protein
LLLLNDELTLKNGSPGPPLGTKQRIESSLGIEYLYGPQNEAEHGNINFAGQYLQSIIVLPYRDDPPSINFIEPKKMLCAFDWVGQQPTCRSIDTHVGIVNLCEYFELRLKTCVLETCNQLL